MSFLNPLFLFGLAAASIPILIHLFTRRRPRETRFPSLEFLSEVNRSEIRRLKLRQWLLLLLRTLAVAAIALAMSRPAVKGTLGPARGAATTVVALVDQSGSMGATGAGGTAIGEARRAVEGLLATLGPEDEMLLVPYDQGPHPFSARPIADAGRLRAASQALVATARATDHARALEFAARALAESHALNRELFWISDFQATGFGAGAGGVGAGAWRAPAGPWDRARVYLMPFAAAHRANVGLTDAALEPSESGAALGVSATSYGGPPGDLSVEVRDATDNAELGRGFLPMPEQGDGSTLLPLARLPQQGGVAIIPDDALALDNRRVFAAGHAGAARVLLREDGPPSPLRLALEAGSPASGLEVTTVDATALPARIAEADVVVLDDLARMGPIEEQAVLDFHRAGGGVMVVLGGRADPAFWNGSLLRELGVGAIGPVEQAPAGAVWRLKRAIAGHPALAGFPARPGEPLSTAGFHATRALDMSAAGGGAGRGGASGAGRGGAGARVAGAARSAARVLLEFDRSRPALVEAPHALVFTAALDAQASDFPVSGAFLPLIHQSVKVLARGTAAASLTPGDRYTAPAGTGTWRIDDTSGHEVPSELVAESGATRLRSAPIEQPGLYRVLKNGALRNTFAVNPPAEESDLTPLPEATLIAGFPDGRAQVLRPGADLTRRVREARYGRELWTWFVITALMLLVAETILARWGLGARTGAETPA
ncbi:MAG: BatA domain-containing protein [Candidatus Eisenbacteria bacterium]|uniref:BatA domain-containing protein n=1 Tax=Eiseniibacteriota bacterium TaxID=2212470 RepID=A0A9D6QIT2_UNCEI|nr:BatA domain-containing protein [Candidatus Eisenbacteria bacterium]